MKTDLALVGGGLANGLIALRLAESRPDIELLVVEQASQLGGNHIWSFHGSDLTSDQRSWISPLVETSWPNHEVRFPSLRRTLNGSYHSVTSRRLDRELRSRLGDRVLFETSVVEVEPQRLLTSDGSTIRARAVIDGRGASASSALTVAYQKFLGLEVQLEEPAGLARPILMDAAVEQIDGFRFVYTLPFEECRLLIEDTRYSDTPHLDRDAMRRDISSYATREGWRIRTILGEEEGVLPIVLAGDIEAFWATHPGVARSGMRAALFHPTTGYSLAEAVRLADEIAETPDLGSAELYRRISERSRAVWKQGRFFRLLNRMLFLAAEPHRRYRVLERFYGLPEALIERFYAGRSSPADRLRILTGRPPVPLTRALRCIHPASASRLNPFNSTPRMRGQ